MINYIVKNSGSEELWDKFIDNSQNGTIFHKKLFLRYHKKKFKNLIFIEFKKKNKIVGLISGIKIKKENKYIFQSPYGASFGGIILNNKLRFNDIFTIVKSFKSFLIKNNFSRCELICTPDHLCNIKSNSLEFCFLKNNFKIDTIDISNAILMEENFLNKVYQNKKKFLKNQKDFDFKITEDHIKFYSFLEKNLKKKFKIKPTHSKKDLGYLLKKFNNKFKIFLCFYKKKIDSAVMTIETSPNKIVLFYIINKFNSKSNSISFLLMKILKYFKSYELIDFGTSSYLGNERSGLIHFKEEFGTSLFFKKKIILNLD